jgi:hypothetical protein
MTVQLFSYTEKNPTRSSQPNDHGLGRNDVYPPLTCRNTQALEQRTCHHVNQVVELPIISKLIICPRCRHVGWLNNSRRSKRLANGEIRRYGYRTVIHLYSGKFQSCYLGNKYPINLGTLKRASPISTVWG